MWFTCGGGIGQRENDSGVGRQAVYHPTPQSIPPYVAVMTSVCVHVGRRSLLWHPGPGPLLLHDLPVPAALSLGSHGLPLHRSCWMETKISTNHLNYVLYVVRALQFRCLCSGTLACWLEYMAGNHPYAAGRNRMVVISQVRNYRMMVGICWLPIGWDACICTLV